MLNAFVQSDMLEIHTLAVVTLTNVSIRRVEQILFVSTLQAASIVNVYQDISEIHSRCARQFRIIATIQIIVFVVCKMHVQQAIVAMAADVEIFVKASNVVQELLVR